MGKIQQAIESDQVTTSTGYRIPDSDDLGGAGMSAGTYDPQSIAGDTFDRGNHTGTQAISTVASLQTSLDAKVDDSEVGSGNGQIPRLDGSGRLPAVDGSQLTNLPGGSGTIEVQEDDSQVAASVDTLNFEGNGVGSITDEGSGKVTVNIALPPSGSGDAVRRNVNSFTGASFTAKLQAAVDSGEPVDIPAGSQTLSATIDLPSGGVDIQGAGDGNRMNGGTLLIGPNGGDIFLRENTTSVQARPAGQNTMSISRMGLRLRPNSDNTRDDFERCTATGYGIGICGIAFIRDDWPTETTSTRSISNAWNHSHAWIHDITCDVENGSSVDHGCGLFHSQGNTYGSRFWNLDSAGGQSGTRRGVHSLLTIAQPYVHRVTCDASTDRVNTSGTNQFLNNQRVVIRAHDATGTRPGGIDFDTVYHVVNRTASSFQISTSQGGSEVNITANGSGLIYAILVGDAGAVFSPDEVYIDRISHYNGKMGVSVCNPERLWLGNMTSYGIETILEIPGLLSTASRTQAVGVTIENIYSESPQATAGNANSECVLVQADGCKIGYMQGRGADSGSQPKYRFTGNDHFIAMFDGRSSIAQGGVDFDMEATNAFVFGQCHNSSSVTTQSDTVGRMRRAGGSGFFFQRNFV